jgi:hypothetical protein
VAGHEHREGIRRARLGDVAAVHGRSNPSRDVGVRGRRAGGDLAQGRPYLSLEFRSPRVERQPGWSRRLRHRGDDRVGEGAEHGVTVGALQPRRREAELQTADQPGRPVAEQDGSDAGVAAGHEHRSEPARTYQIAQHDAAPLHG